MVPELQDSCQSSQGCGLGPILRKRTQEKKLLLWEGRLLKYLKYQIIML